MNLKTLPIETMPKTTVPDDHVVVQIGERKFRTEINAYGFQMISDEPVSAGGQDLGPVLLKQVVELCRLPADPQRVQHGVLPCVRVLKRGQLLANEIQIDAHGSS